MFQPWWSNCGYWRPFTNEGFVVLLNWASSLSHGTLHFTVLGIFHDTTWARGELVLGWARGHLLFCPWRTGEVIDLEDKHVQDRKLEADVQFLYPEHLLRVASDHFKDDVCLSSIDHAIAVALEAFGDAQRDLSPSNARLSVSPAAGYNKGDGYLRGHAYKSDYRAWTRSCSTG